MQMLGCNSWSLQKTPIGFFLPTVTPFFLGRRQLLSSVHICSDGSFHDVVSSHTISIPRGARDGTNYLCKVMSRSSPTATTRRTLLASFFMYLLSRPSRYISAQALGDPSVTVEQVTPPVFPSGELFPTEERIVQLFEKNTYSVVNIFDVTLRPQLNVTDS
uniref:Uncharacterized protein MANES_01G090200 n=1 Tax=Rhizophora mucronata TaxID=61149 RepID=A0A2P2MQV8_RHIMU